VSKVDLMPMRSRSCPATLVPDMARERARSTGDSSLLDLARLRVAQVHGCEVGQAHYREKLQRAGESSARLDRVENWPVSLVFTSRERTVLALAELLAEPEPHEPMLLSHLLREAQDHLTREELIRLVVAIEAMQEWKTEASRA